jgi:hypothetical protein
MSEHFPISLFTLIVNADGIISQLEQVNASLIPH